MARTSNPSTAAALRSLCALCPSADEHAACEALHHHHGDVERSLMHLLATCQVRQEQLVQSRLPPSLWLFVRAFALYRIFLLAGSNHADACNDALVGIHDLRSRRELQRWLTAASRHSQRQKEQAPAAARQLHAACGAPIPECQKSLERADADPDAALCALIASGASALNPRKTTDKHWAFFRLRQWIGRLTDIRSRQVAPLRKRLIEQLRGDRPLAPPVLAAGALARAAALKGQPLNALRAPGLPLLQHARVNTALPAWKRFARAGRVSVSFTEVPSIQLEPALPPQQVAAWKYLARHDAALRDAILAAVLEALPRLAPGRLPPLKKSRDLQPHVGVETIHVLDIAKRGSAFVGIELWCSWDEEHGIGVMTHRDKILAIGEARLAWAESLPLRHAGKRLRS